MKRVGRTVQVVGAYHYALVGRVGMARAGDRQAGWSTVEGVRLR